MSQNGSNSSSWISLALKLSVVFSLSALLVNVTDVQIDGTYKYANWHNLEVIQLYTIYY